VGGLRPPYILVFGIIYINNRLASYEVFTKIEFAAKNWLFGFIIVPSGYEVVASYVIEKEHFSNLASVLPSAPVSSGNGCVAGGGCVGK